MRGLPQRGPGSGAKRWTGQHLPELVRNVVEATGPSPADAGLVRLTTQGEHGPVVLQVLPPDDDQGEPQIVSLRLMLDSPSAEAALARSAVRAFGGTDRTELVVAQPRRAAGAFDVCVWFEPRMSFLAHNAVRVPWLGESRDVARWSEVLQRLGIAHRNSGSHFEVPGRQLRRHPEPEDQLVAYLCAARTGNRAVLHSSTLPMVRSVSLQRVVTNRRFRACCTISYGLGGLRCVTRADLIAIEEWLSALGGIHVRACRWVPSFPAER